MDINLDQLKFNEIEEVHSLWSDESATLFTNFLFLPSIAECQMRLEKMKAYYQKREDHFGPFAIRSPSGEFLGLTGGDACETLGEFEIWYFIQRSKWGQKIATRAVTALLNEMHHSKKVTRVKATAVVDNMPSWKFLEKLGFHRTGLIPEGHIKGERKWDLYVYSKDSK